MALTADNHVIDPHTGFAVDPSTGHPVGLVEYPKWVEPHVSHVVRQKNEPAPDHVSVRGFTDWHISRDTGVLTVLVKNDDEEKVALAEYEPVPDAE